MFRFEGANFKPDATARGAKGRAPTKAAGKYFNLVQVSNHP